MVIGIRRLGAERERRRRRGRPEQHVHLARRRARSRALISWRTFCALQVVGVVVAGREHVGAGHDAPLHLRAEALAARALVEVHAGPADSRSDGRSARRRSARGSTSTPPAPPRSTWAPTAAGSAGSLRAAARRASRTRASASRTRFSVLRHRGPCRRIPSGGRCLQARRAAARARPRSPAPAHRRWWNRAGRSRPWRRSISAASSAVAVSAPAWSRLEANAIMP